MHSLKRLKNDGSITSMFRNSDPSSVEEVPALDPVVKTEVADESLPMSATNGPGTAAKPAKAQFVQIKNREVFDFEPTASSIHASLWPHWWLRAVQSRHKLRKAEAKKNVRFKTGLQHLFKEALEVGTIFFIGIKMMYILILMEKLEAMNHMPMNYH